MTLRHLPLMPKPRAMRLRNTTPGLIDQVDAERLGLLQAYRRLCGLVGKSQAKLLIGRIVQDVSLED